MVDSDFRGDMSFQRRDMIFHGILITGRSLGMSMDLLLAANQCLISLMMLVVTMFTRSVSGDWNLSLAAGNLSSIGSRPCSNRRGLRCNVILELYSGW